MLAFPDDNHAGSGEDEGQRTTQCFCHQSLVPKPREDSVAKVEITELFAFAGLSEPDPAGDGALRSVGNGAAVRELRLGRIVSQRVGEPDAGILFGLDEWPTDESSDKRVGLEFVDGRQVGFFEVTDMQAVGFYVHYGVTGSTVSIARHMYQEPTER